MFLFPFKNHRSSSSNDSIVSTTISPTTNYYNSIYFITTTSTILIYCCYKYLLYRAQQRSNNIIKQLLYNIQNQDGPLVDCNDTTTCERIVVNAIKRASKWMILSNKEQKDIICMICPMIGQVGGLGIHRKPIVSLPPDYICKPLVDDHRGIREIAFYEIIRSSITNQSTSTSLSSSSSSTTTTTLSLLSSSPTSSSSSTTTSPTSSSSLQPFQYLYNNFLPGREQQQQQQQDGSQNKSNQLTNTISYIQSILISTTTKVIEYIDTIAMAMAISVHDPDVLQSEQTLHSIWNSIKLDMDMIRQLHKFTPPYYGVIIVPTTTTTNTSHATSTTIKAKMTTTDTLPLQQNIDTNETQSTNSTPVIANTTTNTAIENITTTTTLPNTRTTENQESLSSSSSSLPVTWKILEDAHLLLQDLTINYSKPCVMDLKMGVQTYEPDSSPEKRAREYGKYPQQTQFGFRIVGMRLYDPYHPDADEYGYRNFAKSYGRSLSTHDEVYDAFQLFFSAGCGQIPEPSGNNDNDRTNNMNNDMDSSTNGNVASPTKQKLLASQSRIRRRTISNILVQLRPIRRWFEDNKSLRFYASSLLLIYEGDVHNSPNPDMTTVKMIDFGRVRRESGGDHGYITGLTTVKNIFADLLKDDEVSLNEKSKC